jgi:hypothetical protein
LKHTITDRALPAVDVKLFREAFEKWHDAISAEPDPRQKMMAGFAAISPMISDDNLRITVSWRLEMLRDLISIPFMERVREHSGFPDEWLDIAATAPLNCAETFRVEDFPWPTGKESAT